MRTTVETTLYFIAEAIKKNRYVRVRVEGASMYPFLKPCAEVFLESPDDIKVGDVVAYNEGDSICLHRVVRKVKTDGKTLLVTKGDANRVKDGPVQLSEVVGRLVTPNSRHQYLTAIYSRFTADCYSFLYRCKNYLFGERKIPLFSGLFDRVTAAPYILLPSRVLNRMKKVK